MPSQLTRDSDISAAARRFDDLGALRRALLDDLRGEPRVWGTLISAQMSCTHTTMIG